MFSHLDLVVVGPHHLYSCLLQTYLSNKCMYVCRVTLPRYYLLTHHYIYCQLLILTVNRWSCLMSVVLQFRTIRNSTVAINDQWLLLKPELLWLLICMYVCMYVCMYDGNSKPLSVECCIETRMRRDVKLLYDVMADTIGYICCS